jgi:hypothetical protein
MSIIRFAFKPNEIPENAVNVQGVHYQAGIYKSSGYNQETNMKLCTLKVRVYTGFGKNMLVFV